MWLKYAEMQMQLRSTDVKFIILGTVFLPTALLKKKKQIKEKLFGAFYICIDTQCSKHIKEIRGDTACIFD